MSTPCCTSLTLNLASLTDHASQLDALRTLRWAAVRHYNVQKAHEKLVARTVNRKLKHLPSALTAQFSVIPSIDSPAPSINNTRHTPATLSIPCGHPDDVSALTHSFMSPAEQTIQHCQPLLRLGPLPSLMTHLPTFRAATLWFLVVVCSVAPPTMFSEAAPSTMLLELLPLSSIICSRTSLTVARNPLFLMRYCQPHLVHPPLNPFPLQPIFHHFHQHLLNHTLFRLGHLPPLRNVPASSSSLSSHSLRILFGPAQCSLAPMPIAIDNGLPYITVSLGSDPGYP